MKGLNSSAAAANLQLEWAVFTGAKSAAGWTTLLRPEDCRGGAAGNGSLIAETDDGGITSLDRRHAACGLGMVRLDSTVGATLRAPLSDTFLLEGRLS